MVVHAVFSSVVQGFGYEKGTLRVVLKNGKAYDYLNVSPEDCAYFVKNFGKALNFIKGKYECLPVTDAVYTTKQW